jgi:hypothetical protein
VADGSTILFWSDVWNDHLLQQKLPRFYSFVKNKNISVAVFLQNESSISPAALRTSFPGILATSTDYSTSSNIRE